MKRLQLEDLAVQLGFSKTLISMVLNGKGDQYGISKKTQVKVLDAVAKLDYIPNKFARALRTGKSNFIGLIVADIANPFYSKIAKNIENVLFEKNYNLMVCSTDENDEREKRLVEMMVNQQGVDGLIIASTLKEAEFYNLPRYQNTPTVFIDRLLPNYHANYVVIDNYGGAQNITNHLINTGSKKIACFSITPSYISTIDDRINGYKNALSKSKLKVKTPIIIPIHFENVEKDVEAAIIKLFKEEPDLDAIFALNNHIATAILMVLKQKKLLSQTNKLKIACFDDIELFNIIDRPVLSVSQPVEEIGKNASLLLLDIIDGKQQNKSNIVLSTTLVER